jgi:hypothetical protein
MGYATVMRVPRVRDYAEAVKKWNNSKPIKGRAENDPHTASRPLGERRDVDTYSIRKNVWTDAIELVLYRTPVIKFTVEDEVILRIDNWPSASTCQFITRVLGVNANRVRGDVVLHFADGTKAMMPAQGELVLVQKDGRWLPKETQTLYDYRVNRKEANNVRKSVSQFRDYLSGVIKLKTEEKVINEGTHYEHRINLVKATYGELIAVFGADDYDEADTRTRPKADKWKISDKPKYYGGNVKDEVWSNYRTATAEFYDLVRNDQDDNARHQNYWIAFNILMVQGQSLHWRDDMDYYITLGAEQFDKFLDRILFKMFSDKVFTKVALAEGKVPTGKYDDYVMTEED